MTASRSHGPDRHFLTVLTVGTIGGVDGAHPAAPQHAREDPRANLRPEPRIRRGGAVRLIDAESFDREAVVGRRSGQHRFDFAAQRGLDVAQVVRPALGRLTLEPLEQFLDS